MPVSSRVGAHTFVAGGLAKGVLPYAREVGAEVVQVFVANPRGWREPAFDAAADAAFCDDCADAGVPVFVHAPYLVNLGSPDPEIGRKSADAIAFSVRRGRGIGARGVVFHAGSAVEKGARDAALARSRELLLPLLDAAAADPGGPRLLVEPTAGGGQSLAATVDELASYLDSLDRHPGLGVCLDTCHLFAAGHDIATPDGMAQALTLLGAAIGPGRLELVHANDSAAPCGSRHDRHANLGAGLIGAEPFGVLFRHPVSAGVPLVVETPGKAAEHRADLDELRRLRAAV